MDRCGGPPGCAGTNLGHSGASAIDLQVTIYQMRFNNLDALADSATEPILLDPATTRILHWPSHYRLSGAGGIAALITSELKPILTSGFCDDQCIIITHSTGDLVARYLQANKLSLLGSSLASRFKVAAVIDLAGAGGGTELANFAVDVIEGVNAGADILKGLLEFAGFDFEYGMNPGVLFDLQPSVARNTAVNSISAIPRLRIAGSGSEAFGFITHAIIKGKDDSVVPLHSACGAAADGAYDSCVQDLRWMAVSLISAMHRHQANSTTIIIRSF